MTGNVNVAEPGIVVRRILRGNDHLRCQECDAPGDYLAIATDCEGWEGARVACEKCWPVSFRMLSTAFGDPKQGSASPSQSGFNAAPTFSDWYA